MCKALLVYANVLTSPFAVCRSQVPAILLKLVGWISALVFLSLSPRVPAWSLFQFRQNKSRAIASVTTKGIHSRPFLSNDQTHNLSLESDGTEMGC